LRCGCASFGLLAAAQALPLTLSWRCPSCQALRRDWESAQRDAQRAELVGGGAPGGAAPVGGDAAAAARTSESMLRATASLEESRRAAAPRGPPPRPLPDAAGGARRVVAETEAVGEATLGDLRGQREQLIHAQVYNKLYLY
jgi:hypothetical protein